MLRVIAERFTKAVSFFDPPRPVSLAGEAGQSSCTRFISEQGPSNKENQIRAFRLWNTMLSLFTDQMLNAGAFHVGRRGGRVPCLTGLENRVRPKSEISL